MGAIYASCVTLPLWCTFFFGYLTLALLLPEQPAWKRFVLLLLLCVFWAPVEGRTAFAVVLFAVFLRGWYALRQQVLSPVLLGCGCCLLCAAAFLYSADTGIYALAALALSLAGVAWESRRESRALRSYASALLAFARSSLVLVIAINAMMATPLDFRFWKNSLAILSGYRWIEPASMSRAGKMHLLVCVAQRRGVVFLVRGVTARNRELSITARSGFLLSAFVFAFITCKVGWSAPIWDTLSSATYAIVFFTGVVLFSFASRIASVVAVLLAVTCSLMFGEPPALADDIAVTTTSNCATLRRPVHPASWNSTVSVIRTNLPELCKPRRRFLQQHSGPHDFMTVFPYQNIFGDCRAPERGGRSLAVVPGERSLPVASRHRRAGTSGRSSWTLPSGRRH